MGNPGADRRLWKAIGDGDAPEGFAALADGADPNAPGPLGRCPLDAAVARACEGGAGPDFEAFAVGLVASGARPLAESGGMGKALKFALSAGLPALSSALIEAGADPLAKNGGGETPLHFAAWGGRAESVRLLVSLGADPDARDKSGSAPLHAAATEGKTEAILALLEAGADPLARDRDGATPLHRAAELANAPACEALGEALAQRGVSVDLPDHFGRTPLDLASGEISFAPSEDAARAVAALERLALAAAFPKAPPSRRNRDL